MIERFNRTLLDYLAKFTSPYQTDWDLLLQPALLAYRAAEQKSTGFSPAILNFGRELKLPTDLVYGSPIEADRDAQSYTLELRNRLLKVKTYG